MKGINKLWNPFVLFSAAIIVGIVGIVYLLKSISQKNRYTAKTTARILSVVKRTHRSNGVTRKIYYPTVEYLVDGTRYEAKGQGSGIRDHYIEGAEIEILYNPNKPEKCLTVEAKDTRKAALITIGIALILAVLGAICVLTV